MSRVGHIHASALSYATGLLGTGAAVIALVNNWANAKGEVYIENLSYPQMRAEIQALLANEVAVAASFRLEDSARKAAQRDPSSAPVRPSVKEIIAPVVASGSLTTLPGVPSSPVENTPPSGVPPVTNQPPTGVPPVTNQPPVVPAAPVTNIPPKAPSGKA